MRKRVFRFPKAFRQARIVDGLIVFPDLADEMLVELMQWRYKVKIHKIQIYSLRTLYRKGLYKKEIHRFFVRCNEIRYLEKKQLDPATYGLKTTNSVLVP